MHMGETARAMEAFIGTAVRRWDATVRLRDIAPMVAPRRPVRKVLCRRYLRSTYPLARVLLF